MSTTALAYTLASEPWLRQHWHEILAILPPQWTDLDYPLMLLIGHKLGRMGVKWQGDDELARICIYLERRGLTERRGDKIRCNPLAYRH